MSEDLYRITVVYVDFPAGCSPEYIISAGHTKEEAEEIIENYLKEVDKDPEAYACWYPHYHIRKMM